MRTPATTSPFLAAFLASLLLLASACGGSGGGPGASGVTASKRLITLTDPEKAQLCDWMVGKAGSYGNPGTCDRTQQGTSTPFLAYDDQAACIEDAADATATGCTATVAELEACISSLPACATLADAASSPACANLPRC